MFPKETDLEGPPKEVPLKHFPVPDPGGVENDKRFLMGAAGNEKRGVQTEL
jgi:hypothetical protein